MTLNVNWPALVEKLGPTLVTYEIEHAGDATKLTLLQSHDRAIGDDILSGGRTGWPAILSSLKSLLETGQAMAIKMQPPAADAGRAEGDGDQDAVGPTHHRRPGVRAQLRTRLKLLMLRSALKAS